MGCCGIIDARLKRKGKALPKPERSLTAAVAARCALPTWYNNLTALPEEQLRTPERALNRALLRFAAMQKEEANLRFALMRYNNLTALPEA